MKSFLVGLGLGIVAGITMAPASGEETRRQLERRFNNVNSRMSDLTGRIRDAAEKVRERGPELMQKAQQQVSDAGERLRHSISPPEQGTLASHRSPQQHGSDQEVHFGIEHRRGMGLIQGGVPAAEVPAEARAGTPENRDISVLEVLNNASRDELTSVRGIGLVLAKRIIRHRPYENIDQVTEDGVLDADTLHQLKRELVDRKRVA